MIAFRKDGCIEKKYFLVCSFVSAIVERCSIVFRRNSFLLDVIVIVKPSLSIDERERISFAYAGLASF